MKRVLILTIHLFFLTILHSQDIKILNILNNDLIYNPVEDKIYTVTPGGGNDGNSLCVINPYFGTIEQCYFVGSEPNTLAISDDGLYIYIGLLGTPEIVKFNTITKSVESSFGLGEDPFFGPYYAEDIEVLPGQHNSIAVSRRNLGLSPKHEGVAIYDDGVMRPNSTQDHTGSNTISFTSNGLLYGYNNETTEFGLRDIIVDTNGATEGNVNSGLVNGFRVLIESQGNLIYSSNGSVVNVEGSNPSLEGTFSLDIDFRTTVEPAPDSNIVYFVTSAFVDKVQLETYDKSSFNNIDLLELSNIPGDPLNLINWGSDGKLAFNTEEVIVILRNCTSLISDSLTLSPVQIGGCWGESVSIEAPEGYDNYYWSNGETTQSISVDAQGEYFFAVSDSLGCLSQPSNAVSVDFDFPPATPFISESSEIEICQGESLVLFASGSSSIDSYLWSNGETTQEIEVSTGGIYSVAGVSENGCIGEESNEITVTVSNDTIPEQPSIGILGEIEFCQGESTFLSATSGFDSYLWSNGASTPEIEVFTSGNYSVQVGNAAGCISTPSEQVTIIVNPTPSQPFIQSNGNVLASSATTGNQWFLNGTPIIGATEQFYTALESGFYTVQVTINGCPSIPSEIYSHTIVNVDELNKNKDILIYPNPSSNILNIEYKNERGENIPLIELFDSRGKSINKYWNTRQISIAHLADGLYFIRIMDTDGSIIQSESILKQ